MDAVDGFRLGTGFLVALIGWPLVSYLLLLVGLVVGGIVCIVAFTVVLAPFSVIIWGAAGLLMLYRKIKGCD